MQRIYTESSASTSPRDASSVAKQMIGSELETLARNGAKRMLQEALELEVSEFLERARYERGKAFRGYRNGHAPERAIGTSLGAVEVRMPRVRDVPKEVAPEGFESKIVGRYQRVSE